MKKRICSRFVTDHLGNQFPSVKTLCEKYNIDPSCYRSRIKLGWSQEEALTRKVATHKSVPVYDHKGNTYPSLKEMCQHYGINKTTLRSRLKEMPLSDALTLPINIKQTSIIYKCEDHTGKEYASITSMCKAYHIPLSTYLARISKGWSVERSLTYSSIDASKNVVDHHGYRYKSIASMCRKYGIARRTYTTRVWELGWSVEKALTTPPRKRSPKKQKIRYNRKGDLCMDN